MKKLIKIIAVCAAIGAAAGAFFCFRDEISGFIKNILDKIDSMRTEHYNDCCFDDSYEDDFDEDYEDDFEL